MAYARRFGACAVDPRNAYIMAKYGFEFFETHFRIVRELSEADFKEFVAIVRDSGIRAEGTNCFADPPMFLLDSSLQELDDYLESSLPRMKELGIEYAVIGSGAARRIPEGMSYEAATEKFTQMLSRYGKIADAYDVDIIVEPLYKKGCNFINSFTEAVGICKAVDHPRIGCLMDFFHSYHENEPFSALELGGKYLKHIHFSALDRRIPVSTDEEEVRMLIRELNAINYTGRIVMEGDMLNDYDAELGEFSKFLPLFLQDTV